jgi:hypothetical protein
MNAVIHLHEVTKRYDSGAAPAVDGVSMQIAPGGTSTIASQRIGRLEVADAWCEALFASGLQPSDALTAETVAEAITVAIRQLGIRGCIGRMAQEFGDHPEAAAERMRWVRRLAAGIRLAAA